MLNNVPSSISIASSSVDVTPLPGDATKHSRILNEQYGDHKLTLQVEGLAGSRTDLEVVRAANVVPHLIPQEGEASKTGPDRGNAELLNPDGSPYAGLNPKTYLAVSFPPGEGWKTITVTLTW
jgi:hypothetical protein